MDGSFQGPSVGRRSEHPAGEIPHGRIGVIAEPGHGAVPAERRLEPSVVDRREEFTRALRRADEPPEGELRVARPMARSQAFPSW